NALSDARITPERIDYINAHGTGTRINDKTETFAIKKVFGVGSSAIPPISSTKSMIGHLVAAAGGVELAACALAMQKDFIPPTINYKFADPECDLDYVLNQARQFKTEFIMSNSFGFGGQNASLILRKV
ncbi:MAG: beta-ketoacyl-[acyl-carrier-protein] synthase II, partial [bacterium]